MANKIIVFFHDNPYKDEELITLEYEGDFDANVSPNGELLIIENKPDLGNDNKGNPIKEIAAIYAKGCWNRVEVE